MVRFALQVLAFAWVVWLASLSVVQAEAPPLTRPLVWLGVKSFQRLEQRVTETAQLMQIPAMAPVVLGVLNLQWSGFQGLDRQRPIVMVMPALVPVENPPLVLVLPYSHEPTLRSTLQRLFPQSTAQSDRLTFRGGFGQRVGRFDASDKVLLVARTPALLHGVEIDLPGNVFAAPEGEESGPDVVLRVDTSAAQTRYPAEWNAWLAEMMQGVGQARDKALAASKTAAETDFVIFVYDVLERRQYQMLHDLDQVEIRITLAPGGWVASLETRWQAQSATAAWVNLQHHATALAPLFSQQQGIRMAASLRQSDAWQQDMQTLLSLAQRVVESHLEEDRHLTSEQRTAYRTAVHTGFDVAAHMLTGPSVEVVAEIQSEQARGADITGWIGLPQSTKRLESLLNMVASVSSTAAEPVGLTRNVTHHHGTPLHRLSPATGETATQTPTAAPVSLFLAAEGSLLAWHVGPSPLRLVQVLDRRRNHTQTPVLARAKRLHLEGPISFWFDLLQYIQPDASGGELGAAAQLLRGVTAPMRLEVTPQPNAATLRWVLPRPLLQGVAGVLRQHIVQTL
ncbi:MAG: hypothetical protein OEU26_22825, partial [Candidatus Tectomicrobia bacterium]|nr:hypothetical protein [Candidatus Tectomicrobia bacterium]